MGASGSVVHPSVNRNIGRQQSSSIGCFGRFFGRPTISDVPHDRGIQDEAHSYRSKIGANRLMLKNIESRLVFIRYCQIHGNAEYAQCFHELDELKSLPYETLVPQLRAFVTAASKLQNSRHKNNENNNDNGTSRHASSRVVNSTRTSNRTADSNPNQQSTTDSNMVTSPMNNGTSTTNNNTETPNDNQTNSGEELENDLAVCLHQLASLDYSSMTYPKVVKVIGRTQDLLLSRCYTEFDAFLKSKELQEHMASSMEREKLLSQNRVKQEDLRNKQHYNDQKGLSVGTVDGDAGDFTTIAIETKKVADATTQSNSPLKEHSDDMNTEVDHQQKETQETQKTQETSKKEHLDKPIS